MYQLFEKNTTYSEFHQKFAILGQSQKNTVRCSIEFRKKMGFLKEILKKSSHNDKNKQNSLSSREVFL